jgi:ABC-type multidrug transport system ATPase subunit
MFRGSGDHLNLPALPPHVVNCGYYEKSALIVPEDTFLVTQNHRSVQDYPNGVKALKDLTLTIGNHMFGLLGPNGAGKSTLMRTVATLQDPDSGTVQLDDLNVLTQKDEVRKVLGYLPQEFGVYPRMSATSTTVL